MMVYAGVYVLSFNLRGDRIMCRRSRPRVASYSSERLDLGRMMCVELASMCV